VHSLVVDPRRPARKVSRQARFCLTLSRRTRRSIPETPAGRWSAYRDRVGINTLVAGLAEPAVQAQGIGFAISIGTARPIADQLVQTGQIVHPFIGIQYVPLNPALAARLGVQAQDGMVVGQVVPRSPAAAAGLRQQDIITAIDAQPLEGESALAEAINGHQPGDTTTLTVLRGRQQVSLQIKLGKLPAT
jgi:S1-C subfamily serine protease